MKQQLKISKYLKENRFCGYSLFILFLFAVGIVDEVYTALLGKTWIIVQDSYLSDMFSAIIAISTLGNAIQALIMGSFNDRILGLTVKEVVQLPACEVKMSYTIKATAVMVLVALCSLAFELYALITVTLIATLFLIAITSIQIWRLLSSEQVVKEIILAAVKSDNTENMPSFFNLSFIVNRLFDELADSIKCRRTQIKVVSRIKAASILRTFDEFCCKQFPNETCLTKELAMKWAEQSKTEQNLFRLNRVSVLRELAKHISG